MSANYRIGSLCLLILTGITLMYSCQSAQELKKEQYFVEGYQLYTTHCANCHQDNGKGMANLYPGLLDSKVYKQPELLPCMIRNGTSGGTSRPMPGNARLTDLEIAEIITYVKVKWGQDSVYTTTEFVQKALAACPKK